MSSKIACKIAVIILVSIGSFFYGQTILAESLSTFDAVIKPHEKQFNTEVRYFDLLLKPKEKTVLELTLTNLTDKDLYLNLTVNPAVTNGSGVVEYSGGNALVVNTVADIKELVTVENTEVMLKARESKNIILDTTMPTEEFEGVLAGGVYIQEIPKTNEIEGNIENIFSREIAIILRNNSKIITPEVAILKAEENQANSRNTVEVEVENKSATYISDVKINYTIMLDGETLTTGQKEQMKIAPNSIFPFRIPLEGKAFKAGDYIVDVVVESGEHRWEGSPSFTVAKEKAKSLNETDVLIDAENYGTLYSTIALVLVLGSLIGFILFLLIKYKNLKKTVEQKEKKKLRKKARK